MNPKKFYRLGYTLIEMMLIVAIIGILTAGGYYKFGDMLQKGRDGSVKSHLGVVRSALNIYFADNIAWFPVGNAGENESTLTDNLVPKYLKEIPKLHVYPYHTPTAEVDNTPNAGFYSTDNSGDGGWAYVSVYADEKWGKLIVECYETDSIGVIWSTQ